MQVQIGLLSVHDLCFHFVQLLNRLDRVICTGAWAQLSLATDSRQGAPLLFSKSKIKQLQYREQLLLVLTLPEAFALSL